MRDYEDQLANPADACREFATNVGAEHPERAWILTDFDTWERNPFYHGPKVPHPEEQYDDESAQSHPEAHDDAGEVARIYKEIDSDEIPF